MEIDKIALLLGYYNVATAPDWISKDEMEANISRVEVPTFIKNQSSVKFGVYSRIVNNEIRQSEILLVYLDFPCILCHYKKPKYTTYYVCPMNSDLIRYSKVNNSTFPFEKPRYKFSESQLKLSILNTNILMEKVEEKKELISYNKLKSQKYIDGFKKQFRGNYLEYFKNDKVFVTNKYFEFCFEFQHDGTIKESVRFIGSVELAKEISSVLIIE